MRQWLLVVVGLLVGAAGGVAVTLAVSGTDDGPARNGQPITAPTGSPGLAPRAEDIAEIEQIVRDYFQAFADDDFDTRRDLSTGELRALADWQEIINQGNFSSREELSIDRLEVATVQGDAAVVDLEAEFTETFVDPLSQGEDTYTLDFSGPVFARGGGQWLENRRLPAKRPESRRRDLHKCQR